MKDASLAIPLNQIPLSLFASSGDKIANKLKAVAGATESKQNAELKKVSEEFEAIFIAHLLKVMRETIEESGLLEGSFGKSTYTELFDQEVSLSLARRGTLGISNLLYHSLSEKSGGETEESGKATDVSKTSPSSDNPGAGSKASFGFGTEIPDLQLPVHAPISSAFGMRQDPFLHQAKFHKGIDLAAPEGMRVAPAMQGRVVYAGYMNGYGNTVVVQHSGELQTRYGHLGSVAVKVGDTVDSRDILGTVGNTGRSTGSHLHFEVIRNGVAVNPIANLSDSSSIREPENSKTGV